MPLLSLVNEGNLSMGWSREGKADDPRVQAAWKAFGGEGDAPVYPSETFRDFDDHLMRTFTEKATGFIRSLGAKALLTNDNCGPRHGEGEGATPCFDYVDSHFYVDHPNFWANRWQLPSSCPNENPLRGGGVPLLNKGYAHAASKPYTITEWNFSGPGRYRALGGVYTAARTAQDGWDALWRFAYSHDRDNFKDGPDQFPGYFDCATDPLGQAGDRASVCLFLRSDADEGTLAIDTKTGSMQFISPRTCGGFSANGAIDAGDVTIQTSGAPATTWVSSLDGKPIASSSRLLAVHLTDAQDFAEVGQGVSCGERRGGVRGQTGASAGLQGLRARHGRRTARATRLQGFDGAGPRFVK